MRAKDAIKLRNRDEIEYKNSDNVWEHAYVLGEPKWLDDTKKYVVIPIQSPTDGFKHVSHLEVR